MKPRAERRLSGREHCTAPARIVDDQSCIIECKLIDLSDCGARLELSRRSGVPKRFTLRIPSCGIEREAELVWQSGYQLGVYFRPETAGTTETAILAIPCAKPMAVSKLRALVKK